MFTVTRSEHNPILSPEKAHPWEAAAVFNGSPIVAGKKTYLIYRAMSEPEKLRDPHIRMSVIGRAESGDGIHYTDRSILISPSESYDRYGCEDPRVTKLGNTYYIFYTGLGGYPFGADNIKIAVALSQDLKTIDERHLVTPFNAKAMAMFPEKINGKIATLVTINSDLPPDDICYVEFERAEDMWSADYWQKWQDAGADAHKLNIRRHGDDHLELGAAPVKTDRGWLVVYSHIQKYGSENQVFGIEILLLDLKNPRNILGRTKGPCMVADAYYENAGLTSHVIFPSGALIKDGKLQIHYGAADTHCAYAEIPLDNLLASLDPEAKEPIVRYPGNPIIASRPKTPWEERGTLNPAAIEMGEKVHILYRAVSDKNVSTIGYASSADGFSIDERSKKPVYLPRASFETRHDSDSNFGCEDPRIVEINNNVYMTYTAYDGSTPRVAITSIPSKNFLAKDWKAWAKPEVITPESIANKDASLIPDVFNSLSLDKKDKYVILHRVSESICAYVLGSLDFSKEKINECIEILAPRRGMWDGNKVGIAAPPIKTKSGWLLLYHGVSWSGTYRVGAALLDLKDPTNVLSRSAVPVFEPIEEYEKKGIVGNVVFPCGLVQKGSNLLMYYGGADFVVGVAKMKLVDILKMLKS